MTLNLAQSSFKIIHFCTNWKHICTFLLVVNSNLDPILHFSEIRRLKCQKKENRHFSLYSSPIPAKIWGCFLCSRSVMLGSTESEKFGLIGRELFSKNSDLYDHDTSTSQTDGRTDRRTDNLPWQYRATRSCRPIKTVQCNRGAKKLEYVKYEI